MSDMNEADWDVNQQISKGLKTLQKDMTDLVGAFVKIADQVSVLTNNMQILATELAILKKKIGENDGTIGNEEETERS